MCVQENLTHDEIWDDSLLIQQYDESMARVRRKLQHRMSATNTEESEQSEAAQKTKDSASDHKNTKNSHLKKKKKRKTKKKYDVSVFKLFLLPGRQFLMQHIYRVIHFKPYPH